jgi:predicted ATPase/DNA-binding CsgD family transcriptional regulator
LITHGGRLPAETSRFFGRSHEAAAIKDALARSRLVTLTGPGGMGKTRLAVRVAGDHARAFPGGVFLADLSTARDADAVARTVTSALGPLGQPGLPGQEGQRDQPPPGWLAGQLRGEHLLLILDTCEHVIDACALLADAILRGGDGPVLLVTSRQPLDLPGEVVFRLAPLDADDAVSLFADRAGAADPGFQVTADTLPKVARLCGVLDGVPLAIELAALRLRAVGLDELLARLPGHLRLLGHGRTGAGERQRSLQASISWSFHLCSPAERLLWTRLTVLADGFDLAAAEAAGAGDGLGADEILDTLVGLVDKSIVLRETGTDGTVRYRLPAIVREHGAALRSRGADPEDAEYAGRWRLLTPREREVAGLVAKGLTNREIAACLVVSKRTVDAHLEHILGKLGYSSRVQVAALASHEQAARADNRADGRSVPPPRAEAAGSRTGAGRFW